MGESLDPDTADDRSDPVLSCELQGGTLSVYEDRVRIERSKRSMFDDKTVPMDEIVGVEYSKGFMNGYVQIRQRGVDHGSGGLFTHPVDENTLHFPRSKRAVAREARDEILARANG